MNKNLRKHVNDMKKMANMLIPHTFPLVDYEEEMDVLILKQKSFAVDGYEVVVSLSRADYRKYHLVSLQIQSGSSPFLPFNVVCNLARAFLGPKYLSYVEFLKGGKKIYCWTVRITPEGRFLLPSKETEPSVYEGFEYNVVNPTIDDVS